MSANRPTANKERHDVGNSQRAAWTDWLTASYRVVPLGLKQSLLALGLGLAICFGIIMAVTDRPWTAFGAFIGGTFRNTYSVGTMIAIATVLGVTALGTALGFRAGAFNIGTEGQIILGGLAAALIAIYLPGPGPIIVILALVAAAVAGGLWIAVPAWLRVRFRTSELLTTLMMNNVATGFALFLVIEFFRDESTGYVQTQPIEPERWLWRWLPPSNANIAILLFAGLIAAYWVWCDRTRSGMRLEATGLQPAFAQFLGIRSDSYLFRAMLTSGALSGLAGGIAILGISHEYIEGFSPQYGFLGITVALIGRLRPLGIVAAAFLYATLITGATAMQSATDVPFAMVYIMQGILILLITSQRTLRSPS